MNATNAYNRLNANVAGLKKASEKLSSGYRINRAGDDAAGLAISEKMRSQIKGLNQATRNAQDGINMVQTFEGAAQETHSILQRMKELATESANGTYDNPTDRAAVQLEFDQLNDELNQIADTDYNGTIVLNGGVMSDGLKQVDGEFNYETAATGTAATDFSAAAGNLHVMAANGKYGNKEADAVWKKLGLDVNKVKEANVTFTYDGKNWNATAVTGADGNLISGAKVSELTTTVASREGATGKGGFKVDDANVNVVFDAMKAKDGDTVTLKFTNDVNNVYASNNIDFKEAGKETGDTDPGLSKDILKHMEVSLDDSVTDEEIGKNPELKEALDQLNAAGFKLTFTAGKAGETDLAFDGTAPTKITLDTTATDGTITIKYGGATNDDKVLATIKLDDDIKTNGVKVKDTAGTPATDGSATLAAKAGGGITAVTYNKAGVTDAVKAAGNVTLTAAWGGGAITWKDAGNNVVNLADYGITLTGTGAAADDGATISFVAPTDAIAATGKEVDAAGDLKFGINAKAYNNASANVDVHSVATPDAAKTAGGSTVSNSNAFGQSKGRLTYTEEITLQTGARTKDAVNFTFKYNTDKTADMGTLEANLDLSSRKNGLNTANLSLANQKEANYAIDQIDKAINKTSMVRATFGSIQNRLEHKITNLTTTQENLTEAESSIRDTDMASEMMNYTKFNILQQAAQSMLAQANQQPQSVLQLLG